ncbi:MAG: tRNA (guanosine(46)-N7)-methyltransferase TrmB [Candidatus Margulisbacteria bacterium]|nr:tRNA (guanosine(46)-N7)-methyltransferase TrmB [Candidatus Margulisiibacteriota bacterium]
MRVRKHANPFNFRKQSDKLQIKKLFTDPAKPLYLEIGFAQGEFLLKMAQTQTNINFLGMEVRKPLVDKINELIIKNNLANICMLHESSTVNLHILPENSIDKVFIFFPDPCFKKKHHKRRIITPAFLTEISSKLKADNEILFQTDVKELFEDTKTYIAEQQNYKILSAKKEIATINETGIPSYFEQRCLDNGWPIYRIKFCFLKTNRN